jgi:hypothetical protein
MDETTKQRLRNPFFTTKERGEGTGLGIAIVQGIVKRRYGYVCVEGNPGAGTSFKAHFPALSHLQHYERANSWWSDLKIAGRAYLSKEERRTVFLQEVTLWIEPVSRAWLSEKRRELRDA